MHVHYEAKGLFWTKPLILTCWTIVVLASLIHRQVTYYAGKGNAASYPLLILALYPGCSFLLWTALALSHGHSQVFSRSRGEKSGESLGSKSGWGLGTRLEPPRYEATTYPCTEFSWYLVTCILFSYTKITANFSVLAGRPQCMVVFLMTQIRPRPH